MHYKPLKSLRAAWLVSVLFACAALAEPEPAPSVAPAVDAGMETTPEAKAAPKAPIQKAAARGAKQKLVTKKKAAAPEVSAHAALYSGRKVGAIEVQGLKRIEKDAVFAKLVTKVGGTVDAADLKADVQALFATGYFDDIEIRGDENGEGIRITVVLRERPVISEIEFDGNERITTSDLEGVIKIKQWSILDVNRVKEDIALIQKHYEDKGFYLARVTFAVEPQKADEVKLVYKINDYDKVQIKKITFLNNRAFSDGELKGTLRETREGGFWSFMSSSGNFKEAAFKNDLQMLTYWYFDHGYVKFRHENPIVTISDDKKWLYVTIYVDEGPQYRMGDIDFSGDLLFSREELAQELTLKTGEVFSIIRRNADIQKLTEKYQDMGYAFANVIPKMNVKDDSLTVDMDYAFEKGNLAHFGEITVVGNSKTHDKVVRRELKVVEGELYHGTRLRESKENVERLGYFQPGEVLFNSSTPKGRNDVVDIEIQVKERPTGTITLGAGYGSVKGLFFSTQLSEMNLFGRGQSMNLSANLTKDKRDKSLSLGFTDPYIFDTKWSAGFDAFFTTFYIPNKYTTRKLGGDIRFGYPIFDYTNAFITYKNEKMTIQDLAIPNPDALDLKDIADDSGVLSSIVWSLVRDKRNNRMEVTGGNYQSLSIETAGIGGDKKFFKFILNNRFYTRLIGDLVFRNSTEYGQATGFDGRVVPPSERFYLGGPSNLKGYQFYGIGPQRTKFTTDSNGNVFNYNVPLGGTHEFFSLFELEHPLIRDAGLKIVAFYDVGNVFPSFPSDGLTLRQDAGFGFRWFSPIGPLRFEWGFPISKRPGEDNSVFNFFIGPPF